MCRHLKHRHARGTKETSVSHAFICSKYRCMSNANTEIGCGTSSQGLLFLPWTHLTLQSRGHIGGSAVSTVRDSILEIDVMVGEKGRAQSVVELKRRHHEQVRLALMMNGILEKRPIIVQGDRRSTLRL